MKQNLLKSRDNKISTTRDQHFHKENREIGDNLEVRIMLDGDKISNNYKTQPYNDFGGDWVKNYPFLNKPRARQKDKGFVESEEIIITKDGLKNFDKYVEHYDILVSQMGLKSLFENSSNPKELEKLSKNPKVHFIVNTNRGEEVEYSYEQLLTAYEQTVLKESKPLHHKSESLTEGAYDSIVSKISKETFEYWKSEFEKGESSSTLDTEYELEDAKGRPLEFYYSATINFTETEDEIYKVDGGSDKGDIKKDIPGFISLTFQVDPRNLPKNWSEISMDIRDVLRHEIEHLTHGKKGYSAIKSKELPDDEWLRELIRLQHLPKKYYFFLEKEVDAMLQGLYFRAKKSKTPFATTINNYLDKVGMVGKDREDILKHWESRRRALSLPSVLNESKDLPLRIFCDLDGVLVDFDKGYYDLTGIHTHHTDNQDRDYFWNKWRDSMEEKNIQEIDWWKNLAWEPDGKELWDYIKKYNPYVLTAPSANREIPKEKRYKLEYNESKQGKTEWVKRLPNMKKIYFAASQFKQQFSGKNKILIDDRESTIKDWREKGGIGILHKNTKDTIKQLQELGL
jgi:hypothetical protein